MPKSSAARVMPAQVAWLKDLSSIVLALQTLPTLSAGFSAGCSAGASDCAAESAGVEGVSLPC